MAKKKKAKKKAKTPSRRGKITPSKPVRTRKRKKSTKVPKKRKTKKTPIVRQATVRYGGVIRTGSYENRRVSYELVADCPRGLKPGVVLKYLETIVLSQFYEAQIEALEGLPPEMRDELGDFSRMSPQEGTQRISEFFRQYVPTKKQMTPEQKAEQIEKLQKELKDLAPQIRDENNRLKSLKDIAGKDLELRAEMVKRQQEIKKELKNLRKENTNGHTNPNS